MENILKSSETSIIQVNITLNSKFLSLISATKSETIFFSLTMNVDRFVETSLGSKNTVKLRKDKVKNSSLPQFDCLEKIYIYKK